MDFSSNINTLHDPLPFVSNLLPQNISPNPRKSYLSRHSNPPTDPYSGLDIFHLNMPKQERLVTSFQGPLYNHVYQNEILINEVLNYFKERHKPLENLEKNIDQYVETGKVLKIRRLEGKSIRVNTGRASKRFGYESKIRCQTAVVSESIDSSVQSVRVKDSGVLRRELIPQTKACSPSRVSFELDALKIRGTNKDFAIRKVPIAQKAKFSIV